MLLGILYPPKQPQETFVVEVDFTPELAAGETIQSATVTARERNTGVDSSSTVLTGATAVTGSTVSIRATAGAAGETHRLQFTIHTPAPFGNIYAHELDVPVQDYAR